MTNFTLADVVAMQCKLSAMSSGRTIVATSFTGLFVHGVETELKCLRFDVSAGLFDAIVAATGAKVDKTQGLRQAKVDVDTWIREGTGLRKVFKDGVWVYPLQDIQTIYEIQGRSSDYGLRDHSLHLAQKIQAFMDKPAPVVPAPVVTPEEMGLDEAEAAYAKQCDRADWYYGYSDDLRVYKAGKANCDALKATADAKGGNYARVYKYYSSK